MAGRWAKQKHSASFPGPLDEIAAAHSATIPQVSLAWLLADHPLISSPVNGATSVEQLDEILGALDVELSEEEKRGIDALTVWA